MTRIEDVSMCGDEGSEVSGKKSADMRKRIEIVNSANANLCISIHQNSYESKDIKRPSLFIILNQKKEKIDRIITGNNKK